MAVFTLSLDCEGLWGVADNFAAMNSGRINQASLADAYALISKTLGDRDIIATAAFVSGFAAPLESVRQHLDELRGLAELAPEWFEHLLPRLIRGDDESTDGLRGDQFSKLLHEGGHELSWHGTTHLSLSDDTTNDAVDLELSLHAKLLPDLGYNPRSIVFPRNRIGQLDKLRAHGFTNYRDSRPSALPQKALALARELWVGDRGDKRLPERRGDWQVIPAGFFLNWPSGARSAVPADVTILRWRSMLRSACQTGGLVHMWFHPHNLITAPGMKVIFTKIMDEVRTLAAGGYLEVRTMAQLAAANEQAVVKRARDSRN